MLRAGVYSPCACCNAHELEVLRVRQDPKAAKWVYELDVPNCCNRCGTRLDGCVRALTPYVGFVGVASALFISGHFGWNAFSKTFLGNREKHWLCIASLALAETWMCCSFLNMICNWFTKRVQIPLLMDDVSLTGRLVSAAVVSEKGSKVRPFGSFVSYLTSYPASSEVREALLIWAPLAISSFLEECAGVSRKPLPGQISDAEDPPEASDAKEGNEDLGGSGFMPGTDLPPNSYEKDAVVHKHEDCMIQNAVESPEPKTQAVAIGPSLRNAECFASTEGNIASALDNRNQAPPFNASRGMKLKINKTVDALIKHVFTADKIKEWRVAHTDKDGNLQCTNFFDMGSKKWTGDRLSEAVDEAYADIHSKIEQEFQNKTNEVQDAGSKLPRPRNIIQCGDGAQVKMLLPVKCFEDILFGHFKIASIKKAAKKEAMNRIAAHLNQRVDVCTVEGDGSSWDACCNADIRDMTENKILGHIISVLGYDADVPASWMNQCLDDMKKKKIKGKAKINDFVLGKCRVTIDSIRQSGHRGTSCFNYLINLVNWLCVLCENPEDMIKKVYSHKKRDWVLPQKYISAYDGQEYNLRYAFEGDDSALTSTENLKCDGRKKNIIDEWTSLGFKMKLVFCDKKMTFTGYDFLVGKSGPTKTSFPEIKRNIASSSWTTSPEVRQFPGRVHRVAAAAFLARAENFIDCEPLCHYFAALGKAHVLKVQGSTEIEEAEALTLGIIPGEIIDRLDQVVASTSPLTKDQRDLMEVVLGKRIPEEKLCGLINLYVDDPLDTARIKNVLPKEMWYEEKDTIVRPRGEIARLLQMCQ